MFAHALSIRSRRATTRVVRLEREEAEHDDEHSDGEQRDGLAGAHGPIPGVRAKASTIAEPIASTAPSNPMMNVSRCRPAATDGSPNDTSSGMSGPAAMTSWSGGMSNVLAIRDAASGGASAGRWAAGSRSGSSDRRTDAEPGDRRVAPGERRVSEQHAGLPRLGDVHGHLRVVRGQRLATAQVRLRRVGKRPERHRPPDDRHGIARFDARLDVLPIRDRRPVQAASRRRAAGPASAGRRSTLRGPARPAGTASRCGCGARAGRRPCCDDRSSKRAGTSQRALRGNTRTSPEASRTRKPTARSSSRIVFW